MTITTTTADGFDAFERRAWAGQAEAYARTYGLLCGYTVPRLLDAAGVGPRTRVLDAGTGPGTVAAAAHARGADVAAVDAEPSMAAAAARAVPEADVRVAVLPGLPFDDGVFDAVVGNFVLNHVSRPLAALGELRRVLRPGGRLAVTVWTSPNAAGQALLGRAVQAAGVPRPPDAPRLDPADDFPRSEAGLAGLLARAGFDEPAAGTVAWDHRADPDVWWSGPAAGIATVGQLLAAQSPEVVAEVRRHYDLLAAEFLDEDGLLVLPHTALLASARRP